MPYLGGRRRGQGNFGLFLLAGQIMNMGVDKIPPVTLLTVAAQVAIFLNLGDLERWFYSAESVCISSYKVWMRRDWSVIILSALYHANDIHLYYNMASFLWKGRQLERKFGSVYFAFLLVVFTVLTSLTYVGLNVAATEVFHDKSYMLTCAVGFSGVIFALKVLVSYYTPAGTQYVLGFIPVPSRIVFWVELVIIQLITPHASFTGHLAGILVGLLYIKGPLKILMDSLIPPGRGYNGRQQSYSYNRGSQWGAQYQNNHGGGYTTGSSNYTQNHGGMSEEEQTQRATEESLRQNRAGQERLYPDLDDLRRMRQSHYQ